MTSEKTIRSRRFRDNVQLISRLNNCAHHVSECPSVWQENQIVTRTIIVTRNPRTVQPIWANTISDAIRLHRRRARLTGTLFTRGSRLSIFLFFFRTRFTERYFLRNVCMLCTMFSPPCRRKSQTDVPHGGFTRYYGRPLTDNITYPLHCNWLDVCTCTSIDRGNEYYCSKQLRRLKTSSIKIINQRVHRTLYTYIVHLMGRAGYK